MRMDSPWGSGLNGFRSGRGGWHGFETRGDAHPGDRQHLLQRGGKLEAGVAGGPALEFVQDPDLRVMAHGDDEREAVPGAVRGIQPADPRHLFGRQPVERRARLLDDRRRGHRSCGGFLPGEIGVGAQELHLLGAAGALHRRDHRRMQRMLVGERAHVVRALGHPRRMLEDVAERRDERRLIHPIDCVDVHCLAPPLLTMRHCRKQPAGIEWPVVILPITIHVRNGAARWRQRRIAMARADDPFDTYLLRVLRTLVAERSVSRTAIKLNQSQPAISAALKRLREIFHDPLVVRDRGAMVPTQRALELEKSARIALDEIDRLIAGPDRFDPASAEQDFQVGSPDFLSVFFLARVVEQFREQSPQSRLIVRPLGVSFDYEHALAEGDLDVVIGNWPQPPEHLHLSLLLEDDIVCLLGKENPYARKGLTREQYLRASHLVPVPYSVAHRGVVETHLATLRLRRNATVMLPYFNMAPYLLPKTDLVFTTSRHFARFYANLLPLAVVPSPIEFPKMRFYQLWHERTHQSQAHK